MKFFSIILVVNALIIIELMNAIDLFTNLGIGFLSSSKKAFNPFFIFKFVKYINKNNTIKFMLNAIAVYLTFCQNISVYFSPISNISKY